VLLGDRGSRWRCLLVWASGTSALGVVALLVLPDAWALWAGRSAVASLPLDVLLRRVSACVLLACACWAWPALTATVSEAWRGAGSVGRGPWALPAGVRRVVLAACGVALVSGVVAPARADHGLGAHRHAHGLGVLRGLPLPERAVAPPRSAPRTASAEPARPARVVDVHVGDTLWVIAERDLPPGASDHDVARHWHAIYAANCRQIGPDPDVIRPGQHLHLPPLARKDRP
jgi:LysM repeat protein